LSDVTVSDILDSDHLPVLLHILNHVIARDILAPVKVHTDWERFPSLDSEIISPKILIVTIDEAEEAE
jgi:hypothetical protein